MTDVIWNFEIKMKNIKRQSHKMLPKFPSENEKRKKKKGKTRGKWTWAVSCAIIALDTLHI